MPSAATATAQDLDCDAIDGYLDEVDAVMANEVHALVTRPGWVEDARDITRMMNTAGSSSDEVSADDIAPLLELFAIPHAVLSAMDADAVPDDALALHESAVGFWEIMPDWINAELAGDEDAWKAAMAELAASGEDNTRAQAGIDASCPGLIDGHMDNVDALGALFDGLEAEAGTPVALAISFPEDLDGMGVYFLVMPAGMAGAFAEPASVATPTRDTATVKTVHPDATPTATPGS